MFQTCCIEFPKVYECDATEPAISNTAGNNKSILYQQALSNSKNLHYFLSIP